MAQTGLCSVRLAPIYERLDEVWGEIARTDTAQRGFDRSKNTINARLNKRRKAFQWVLGAVDENGKYDLEASTGRLVGLLKDKFIDEQGGLKKLDSAERGFFVKLAQDTMEANSMAIQDVASKWLLKAGEGQLALEEGAQLMRLLDGMVTITEAVNKGAFDLGTGLQEIGLDFTTSARMRELYGDDFVMRESDQADIGKFKNSFDELADLFNSGRTSEAVEQLRKLATKMTASNDPTDVIRATRGMKSLPARVWDEVMINGLLWSPASMVTNAMGLTWAFARPMFQLLGAQAGITFGNSTIAKQAAAEAMGKLSAMYSGFGDGFKLGWQAFQKERSIYGKTTSFGRTRQYAGPAITAANLDVDDSVAGMVNALGRFYRIPSRVMMGSDELVKHITMRGEAAAMGIRRGIEEGRMGQDWTSYKDFEQYITNEIGMAFDGPQLSNNLAYEYVGRLREQAAVSTFQESNAVAGAFQQIIDKVPILRPFFPFVRTPLNMLKQGVWESTGMSTAYKGLSAGGEGVMNQMRRVIGGKPDSTLFSKPTEAVIMKNLSDMADPVEGYRVAGQIAFTSSMIAFFYTGAMSGWITGGGPGRWENKSKAGRAQEIWLKSGNIPYTIKIPGTNTVLPFDRLGEPLANVMRIVTDMAMFSGYATQEEKDATMFGLANVAVTGLYQQSFLQGLKTLMDAITNDNEDGSRKGRLVQNWVSAQTPFGGLLNYVANVTDPYDTVYEGFKFDDVMKAHEGGFGVLLNKIGDRMPGRGGHAIHYDQVTGNPLPAIPGMGAMGLNAIQLAIPFFPRGIPEADETWSMINKMTPVLPDKKVPIDLTEREQQWINKRMSEVKVNGLTYQQAIRRFYNRSDVQKFVNSIDGMRPDSENKISQELRAIGRKYRDLAYQQLQNENTSVQQRAAVNEEMNKAYKRNDQAGGREFADMLQKLFEDARYRGVF